VDWFDERFCAVTCGLRNTNSSSRFAGPAAQSRDAFAMRSSACCSGAMNEFLLCDMLLGLQVSR